jgi:uncharacterized RDD family membrane protein YckC
MGNVRRCPPATPQGNIRLPVRPGASVTGCPWHTPQIASAKGIVHSPVIRYSSVDVKEKRGAPRWNGLAFKMLAESEAPRRVRGLVRRSIPVLSQGGQPIGWHRVPLPSRALGAFVDTVILAPVVVPVNLFVHPTWLAFSIVTAIGCAYQVPQIAIWGLTPGCRSAEIKVTNRDGRPPRWTRAVLRWATPGVISNGYRLIAPGRIGLLAGILVICILYAPALFDPWRRAIIDRVAGTIVLERAASVPRP